MQMINTLGAMILTKDLPSDRVPRILAVSMFAPSGPIGLAMVSMLAEQERSSVAALAADAAKRVSGVVVDTTSTTPISTTSTSSTSAALTAGLAVGTPHRVEVPVLPRDPRDDKQPASEEQATTFLEHLDWAVSREVIDTDDPSLHLRCRGLAPESGELTSTRAVVLQVYEYRVPPNLVPSDGSLTKAFAAAIEKQLLVSVRRLPSTDWSRIDTVDETSRTVIRQETLTGSVGAPEVGFVLSAT